MKTLKRFIKALTFILWALSFVFVGIMSIFIYIFKGKPDVLENYAIKSLDIIDKYFD